MINSESKIYIKETEIKPNRASSVVLIVTLIISAVCWIVNEIGIFRVGKTEMRIGSIIPIVMILIPLLMVLFNRKMLAHPAMKYINMSACFGFTFAVGTMLTFHTTIMLLFPIFFAMLYRSKSLGKYAMFCSLFSTIATPILAYMLGTWDVELFKELILIATGIQLNFDYVMVSGSLLSVGKIVLYIVGPRLMMVGACAILMFRVISISTDHVNTEILLNKINHRDALTGLYNQNYYKEVMEEKHSDGFVGVIFFDVNGLKKLNDSYGHEAGDLLLKRSAASLLKVCNDENISAFRVGGDEFVMIIEGANEIVLNHMLKEWNRALDEINEENKTEYNGLVCSMASGCACGRYEDIEQIIKDADACMYENKIEMKQEIAGEA